MSKTLRLLAALGVAAVTMFGAIHSSTQTAAAGHDQIVGIWYASTPDQPAAVGYSGVARFSENGEFIITDNVHADNPDYGYWSRGTDGVYTVWYVHVTDQGLERTTFWLVFSGTSLIPAPSTPGSSSYPSLPRIELLSKSDLSVIAARNGEQHIFRPVGAPPR
jgi:hypothetical protein